MRVSSGSIALLTSAIALHADAAVTYHSLYRELSVRRTTQPSSGIIVSSGDSGYFSESRSTGRLVQWNGITYQIVAVASMNSEINAAGIVASGTLGAGGTPISPPVQGPLGIARVDITATFSVDIDTPFNLIASAFAARASDRFVLALKDADGNPIVLVTDSGSNMPIAFSGTLTPGQYSFQYLAELTSGPGLETNYSIALAIPSPASLCVLCAALPLTGRRRRC